ncbi:46f8a10d-1410-4903-8375-2ebbba8d002f [Thermothielavioides terrestris]|uniref:46f8a10d-1410-4903-8375-2ebbba8d002f n=1 Tax=Thermothielavioides terrestris TaxID=2587410 RepID=A0A3S4CCB3_9PEZI|nr:46f8a10d-1410-4903-8375-2ebbba8d002f [Thermothielavioides terrestris]
MNVAGLPAILNTNDAPDFKATNAATIGSRFAEYGYDVIHVQETATSGGVPFGSGLNALSNFDWVNFRGTTDCMAPKGFTFVRIAISGSTDNTSVAFISDFYNLHADAGTEAGDNAVRSLLASQNGTGPGLAAAWVELERSGDVPSAESLCENPAADA